MNMAGDQFKRRPDSKAVSDMKSSGKNGSSLEGNELRRASQEVRTASSGDGRTKISDADYTRLDTKLSKLEDLVVQRVIEAKTSGRRQQPVEQPHSQQRGKTPEVLTHEEEEYAKGLLRGFVDF
jgi:hypothetical protein